VTSLFAHNLQYSRFPSGDSLQITQQLGCTQMEGRTRGF
jgi:hypothetical protein